MKAKLPDSVDMIPGTSLGNVSPEPQTARRWRLTQLDYEEFPNEFDDDPKLQALRRLGQKPTDGVFQRRVQADAYAPPRQNRRMQDYSSDSEDIWEPENTNQVDDQEAYVKVPDANEGVLDDDDDPKLQRLGRGLKSRDFPRNLSADAYGPPMQYMRMQEYGSQEQDNSNMVEPESFVGDGADAERPDDNVNSRQGEQLTTVDEFLGSGRDRMRTRESDVELVQEEEV